MIIASINLTYECVAVIHYDDLYMLSFLKHMRKHNRSKCMLSKTLIP